MLRFLLFVPAAMIAIGCAPDSGHRVEAVPLPDLSNILHAGQTVAEARFALGVPDDNPQVYVGTLNFGTIPLSSPRYKGARIYLHVEGASGSERVKDWAVLRDAEKISN